MLAFVLWLCASTILIPRVEIGLDQEVSMPRDSFVLKYFQFLKQVRDQYLDISDTTTHQSMMNTELSQQRCFGHFMRKVRHDDSIDDPKTNMWVLRQALLTLAPWFTLIHIRENYLELPWWDCSHSMVKTFVFLYFACIIDCTVVTSTWDVKNITTISPEM